MSNRDSKLALSRRMLLRGVGGFALALPFLPSLAEKRAEAAPTGARPRLFWLGTDHGGAFDANMFPSDSLLTNHAAAVAGHTVSSGRLAATVNGSTSSLSPILSASSSALTPRLVGKMNVIRGLDVPFYIAHNTGLHLGNFARNDNNGNDGAAVTAMGMRPTIDQIMASSSSFYTPTDLAGTKLRAMVVNPGRQLSWAFANPQAGVSSPVQSVQGATSSLQIFNTIFGGSATHTRPPVADKVLQSYNSLRQSNTRLSAADRIRLDSHIAMIAQLQGSLNAHLACSKPATPTDDAGHHQGLSKSDGAIMGHLWADVFAASFACDASRIAVYGWGDTSSFSDYLGNDWHQDVAHQWSASQPQAWLKQSYQAIFENVFVYLAQKLDQLDEGNGTSVLDNTLMVWSQECGMATHDSYSIPIVTFGSAAGYFNTGLYVDYRKVGESGAAITNGVPGYSSNCGLLYSQWLANVLQAMGVTRAEFELWKDSQGQTAHGYGTPYLTAESWEPPYVKHYGSSTSPYFKMASDALPFLVA